MMSNKENDKISGKDRNNGKHQRKGKDRLPGNPSAKASKVN